MATKKELEEALIEADKQVNDLESEVDELKKEIGELKKEPDLKDLKIMLCDRYALNHLTNWETLICKLEDETRCV